MSSDKEKFVRRGNILNVNSVITASKIFGGRIEKEHYLDLIKENYQYAPDEEIEIQIINEFEMVWDKTRKLLEKIDPSLSLENRDVITFPTL